MILSNYYRFEPIAKPHCYSIFLKAPDVMPSERDAQWLTEARLIDRLVREELQRRGIPLANTKSFDELVASGELKAAECHVLSRDMVKPGWRD